MPQLWPADPASRQGRSRPTESEPGGSRQERHEAAIESRLTGTTSPFLNRPRELRGWYSRVRRIAGFPNRRCRGLMPRVIPRAPIAAPKTASACPTRTVICLTLKSLLANRPIRARCDSGKRQVPETRDLGPRLSPQNQLRSPGPANPLSTGPSYPRPDVLAQSFRLLQMAGCQAAHTRNQRK